MLLGTLGASLLGNLSTRKGMYRSGEGMKRIGEGIYRAGQEIKKKTLMPPHPLTNFEIKDYYKNKPKFNDVYSRDHLPKIIKNGAYVVNLDEYADVGTDTVLYVKNNEVYLISKFWCRACL